MPYYPYTDTDPITGRYPSGYPSSGLLNNALNAVCGALGDIGAWTGAAYRAAGIPSGPASWLAGIPIIDGLCGSGAPTPPPIAPGVPPFPVNCATFGTVDAQIRVAGTVENPFWLPTQDIWDCNANVGRPIGQPRWANLGGSNWGYVQLFERADGTGTVERNFGSTTFGDQQERVQITNINIQYCPGCGLPPPPPVPPVIPERDDDPEPTEPPQIIINIDFPTPPGLPPISFPITYSPTLNLDISPSLNAPITLAPRLDINPNFNFAPTIELSVGGISIGGGGYPEGRPDVAEILECDCPDPCPPPGGSVDYGRIAQIVETRLSAVRDIPDAELGVVLGDPIAGTEIEIGLPDGIRGIQYEMNLSGYTGGASFASTTDRSVFYPGYCWFGESGEYPGGIRIFINARAGFIPAPPFASRFVLVCKDGAIATIRTVTSAPFPPP